MAQGNWAPTCMGEEEMQRPSPRASTRYYEDEPLETRMVSRADPGCPTYGAVAGPRPGHPCSRHPAAHPPVRPAANGMRSYLQRGLLKMCLHLVCEFILTSARRKSSGEGAGAMTCAQVSKRMYLQVLEADKHYCRCSGACHNRHVLCETESLCVKVLLAPRASSRFHEEEIVPSHHICDAQPDHICNV